MQKRSSQTQRFLLVGFGGLLALLAVSGLYALSVLGRIQTENASIRQDFVNRERILEQLRSDVFLSGTYVRDLLLEQDANLADAHRRELRDAQQRIDENVRAYSNILRAEEKRPFTEFASQVTEYFLSLRPALEWSPAERRRFGYAFMKESLMPRRMVVVHLADQISRVNQKQGEAGNKKINELFAAFRKSVLLLLTLMLLCGILLAAVSIRRILRLERVSAQRFQEVERAQTALRDLSTRLLDVQESERKALSRELHDEVGQSISALLLGLGNVAAAISGDENAPARGKLQDLRRLTERTLAAVRDMSLLLRPSMLDDLGLIPALEWQARETSRTKDLAVQVHADESVEQIPDEHKTCVYRLVQEALHNITRHARAKNVTIYLSQDVERLLLTIEDDGRGFAPGRQKGLGLLGMEERVKHLKGSLAVRSEPQKGTSICAELPLSEKDLGVPI